MNREYERGDIRNVLREYQCVQCGIMFKTLMRPEIPYCSTTCKFRLNETSFNTKEVKTNKYYRK